MSALGQKQTCAVQNAMSALPPKATSNATCEMSAKSHKLTSGQTSDEHSSARQNYSDFGELARLRIDFD